jgi:1,4-dihydroxy-2-naphthoyl-CoA hydrolase
MSDPTAQLRDAMPLLATLGARATRFEPGGVDLELDWSAGLCTSAGLLHGGVVMALADAAGGACAFANLPDGAAGTSTASSSTSFLAAVRDGTVHASARPVHVGGTTIVVQTEVRDGRGRLVSTTTQTQMVLRPR